MHLLNFFYHKIKCHFQIETVATLRKNRQSKIISKFWRWNIVEFKYLKNNGASSYFQILCCCGILVVVCVSSMISIGLSLPANILCFFLYCIHAPSVISMINQQSITKIIKIECAKIASKLLKLWWSVIDSLVNLRFFGNNKNRLEKIKYTWSVGWIFAKSIPWWSMCITDKDRLNYTARHGMWALKVFLLFRKNALTQKWCSINSVHFIWIG